MTKNTSPELAKWVNLNSNTDPRGRLVAIDFRQLDFTPARAFYIDNVPLGSVRGAHAHANGSQLLFCLHGEIEVELRRNDYREVVSCKPGGQGLLIEKGIWSQQKYTVSDSVLLVLSSLPYELDSYLDQHGNSIERLA